MRSLYLLVFTTGLVTLGMELSASRLLEPAFGNSQIVWAAIIGLILLSLAIGAWLGGWLADRLPHRSALELTLTAGAVAVALVPLLSTPALRLASQGLADFAPGLLLGALLAVSLLFAIPAVLLGTATPWAVRLAVEEGRGARGEGRGARSEERGARGEGRGGEGEKRRVGDEAIDATFPSSHNPSISQSPISNLQSPISNLGKTAGRLSATGTAGSLIGAFLPVLWLIPAFGTRWTFYLLSLLLLAVVTLSALNRPHRWIPLAALLGVLAMALLLPPQGIRTAWDDGRSGAILYENESAFNYIAVRQWGSERHLKLNDGIGIHSVYHPDARLSQGIWDYFLLAPLFRERGRVGEGENGRPTSPSPSLPLSPSPSSLLLIGAAAGTVAGLYTDIYGPVAITGVELDPEILRVGKAYFGATWPNYTTVAADGRRWLAQQPADARFDVIAIDAYRPPYIPFHLTTVEFFELVRDHLTDDGVMAVNVGRSDSNYALVDAMTATMQQVFPSVFVIDEPGPPHTLANSLVVATRQPTTLARVHATFATLPMTLPAEFIDFAHTAAQTVRVAAPPSDAPIFTDDHSRVEQVVHELIVDFIFGG